jgi:hypothetical protein
LHNGLSPYDVFALASYLLWWVLVPVLLGLAWLGIRWARSWPAPGGLLAAMALGAAAMVGYAALTIR